VIAVCRSLWASVFCVLLLVAVGCSKPSVKVDGSSTVYLITEAVAEEFRKERPEVRVIVGFSGTGGGMKKFSAGELDIVDASRAMKDEEKSLCAANGIEFIELEVAFDGLSVVVNPENDWCDCLTVDELKAIWQPESAVSKWSDINPDWPAREIQLYGAGTDSGTFEYFTEAIVGTARSSRPDYTQNEDDNVLVRGVEGNKDALGYFGYAYYEANQEKLKLLGVDSGDGNCVKPSLETVRDNTYKPLSRPLYIYVRKSSLERPEVAEFVKFYVAQASSLASQVGYVPVTDEIDARNHEILEAALAAGPAS
jgi:phosphate transport system substrate-binding protein